MPRTERRRRYRTRKAARESVIHELKNLKIRWKKVGTGLYEEHIDMSKKLATLSREVDNAINTGNRIHPSRIQKLASDYGNTGKIISQISVDLLPFQKTEFQEHFPEARAAVHGMKLLPQIFSHIARR